jgi:DNA-directed RNA polymerase specialized sigma24 family protein
LLELKAAENLATGTFPPPVLTESEDILPVIQALPPAYRMVFNLFVMEGYSHDEIGEMLGISAGTSRSNLSRAKEKLRELLTPETVKTLKMS